MPLQPSHSWCHSKHLRTSATFLKPRSTFPNKSYSLSYYPSLTFSWRKQPLSSNQPQPRPLSPKPSPSRSNPCNLRSPSNPLNQDSCYRRQRSNKTGRRGFKSTQRHLSRTICSMYHTSFCSSAAKASLVISTMTNQKRAVLRYNVFAQNSVGI